MFTLVLKVAQIDLMFFSVIYLDKSSSKNVSGNEEYFVSITQPFRTIPPKKVK